MSLRFQAEVASLAERGITLGDLTPDELEAFVKAVMRCDRPFSTANAELIGIPIRVAEGVYFWKLTVGASVWLDQYARRWWFDGGKTKAYFWAIVYALLHARDKDAFVRLQDEPTAFEAIKQDALKLAVHEDEVTEAVDYALGMVSERPASDKPTADSEQDWCEVVSRLEAQSGIKAEDWLWGRSLEYTKRSYIDLTRFAKAMQGQKTNRMKDELDNALNALARLKASIVARIEAERKEAKA